jgi:hypothetical protein
MPQKDGDGWQLERHFTGVRSMRLLHLVSPLSIKDRQMLFNLLNPVLVIREQCRLLRSLIMAMGWWVSAGGWEYSIRKQYHLNGTLLSQCWEIQMQSPSLLNCCVPSE